MNKIYISIISAFVSLLVLVNSFFVVNQKEIGVVLQFGEALRIIDEAGLNFKIPFIQNVKLLDKRILHVIAEEKELTASDEKRVIVDAYAKYKIVDPIKFIKTVYDYSGANLRLNKILESAMRTVIGRYPLNTLLTEERSSLMLQIKELSHQEVVTYGIRIIDVRILKSDLPAENSAAIYQRMQTEREKEAKQIRAEGEEESAKIKSKADRESKVILADAYMTAQKIKGQGDAEATRLYNNTYSKDPNFYEFYRSLIAYKNSLNKDNTQFVISPKSSFFKYLKIDQ
ncbi:MAG TPA: protease modulator HflC [Candidatus Megaira endosymbiont of Nemacystus decipiens]|nr:protease modulator HflC [Candidatus Megaera endosymbiont of Nemacystus decipiens]